MSRDTTHSPAAAPPPSPLAGFVMALLAGAIGWALIQGLHPVFKVPKDYHIEAMGAPQEKVDALLAATARTDAKNLTLYFSVLGALLALGLAACQRSLVHALVALPIGLVLGGLAGSASSLAYQQWIQSPIQAEMSQVVAVQAVLLGSLGIAAGLSMGVASRSAATMVASALGGLAAGALAGALYPVVMSLAMPAVNTAPLLPLEAASRLLWIELAAGLIGLMVPVAMRSRPQPSEPATA